MTWALGTSSRSNSSCFATNSVLNRAHARCVAAGPIQACDESQLDRVVNAGKDDRNGRSRRLRRYSRWRTAARDDHSHLTANQIRRQVPEPIVLAFRPAVFDRYILPLDVTGLLQSFAKSGCVLRVGVRRAAAEKANHRHRRLLRPRRHRPRRRRAAEQGDELAARIIRSPRRRGRAASEALRGRAPWRS